MFFRKSIYMQCAYDLLMHGDTITLLSCSAPCWKSRKKYTGEEIKVVYIYRTEHQYESFAIHSVFVVQFGYCV